MAYYTRKHWTSASNAAVSVKRKQVHVTLHYPGFGSSSVKTAGWSLDRCFRQLRAWRNMHVGSGAYKEVAYNLYALPTGDVAEGRGNRQNGANGTSTANRAGMSIQVLIGDNEDLTMGHLKAIFEALALLERWHPGITKRQYGHSHWVSTRCPGPKVRAGIPYSSGKVPVDGGGSGLTGNAPGLSDGLADVDKSQKWLKALGYDPGPLDGKFGEKTRLATKAFQADFGISPADGRPGPATRNILEAAVTQLNNIEKKLNTIIRTLQPGIAGKRTDGELVSTLRGFRNDIPGMVLDAPVKLKGSAGKGNTTARTKIAYAAHEHRVTQAAVAGVSSAIEKLAEKQGVDPSEIREAVQAGVDDALKNLEISVSPSE